MLYKRYIGSPIDGGINLLLLVFILLAVALFLKSWFFAAGLLGLSLIIYGLEIAKHLKGKTFTARELLSFSLFFIPVPFVKVVALIKGNWVHKTFLW